MRIKMNGWTTSCDVVGTGIPLLMIHGFPLSRKLWQPQLLSLSTSAKIITPDLRGHGESDAIPGPYSIDDMAEDCISIMNGLEIHQPFLVCGLSMGGYIALSICNKYPQRVAGLILAATRATDDTADGKENRTKAIELAKAHGAIAIADNMLQKMFAPATYHRNPLLVEATRSMMISTSLEGIIGSLEAMRERSSYLPTLTAITQPSLVIHGNQDQIIPITEAQAMDDLLSDSNLVIVNEAGHLLNLEKPQEFNSTLLQFINRF